MRRLTGNMMMVQHTSSRFLASCWTPTRRRSFWFRFHVYYNPVNRSNHHKLRPRHSMSTQLVQTATQTASWSVSMIHHCDYSTKRSILAEVVVVEESSSAILGSQSPSSIGTFISTSSSNAASAAAATVHLQQVSQLNNYNHQALVAAPQENNNIALDLRDVFRILGLSNFSDLEIDELYDAIIALGNEEQDHDDSLLRDYYLTEAKLQNYLDLRRQQPSQQQQQQQQPSQQQLDSSNTPLLAREILVRLGLQRREGGGDRPAKSTTTIMPIDKALFRQHLQQAASQVDYYQIFPIALSMSITGIAVGIVNPAMPLVVASLELSSSDYGTIVSAFGLAKLLLNIPAAVVTERYGRKPFLTYGSMPLLALGTGGIGYADSGVELFILRLLTGTGVALLSTAATLMVTDIASTPRNRASSIAPVMSGFSIGMVVGPGIGGYAMEQFGLQHTFYMVGASYLLVGILNQFLLKETKIPVVASTRNRNENDNIVPTPSSSSSSSGSFWQSTSTAVSDWGDVISSQPAVRNVIGMNAVYWTTMAGAQMTILPLLLTESAGYSVVDVGHVYMGMSALQIVGNPFFAAISDRIGRIPVLLSGTTIMGGSLFFFHNSHHPELLLPALAVWSLGSSMLSTAPVAYVSDRVPSHQRAAAIALLRTAGDVGLLVGSMGTGYLAYKTSIPTAMESLACLIWTSTALLGTSVALRKWRKTE